MSIMSVSARFEHYQLCNQFFRHRHQHHGICPEPQCGGQAPPANVNNVGQCKIWNQFSHHHDQKKHNRKSNLGLLDSYGALTLWVTAALVSLLDLTFPHCTVWCFLQQKNPYIFQMDIIQANSPLSWDHHIVIYDDHLRFTQSACSIAIIIII